MPSALRGLDALPAPTGKGAGAIKKCMIVQKQIPCEAPAPA